MENKNLKIFLMAAAALALVVGCGIKGPPLPPIETIEAEAINGKAVQASSVSATTQAAPASTDQTKPKK